MKKGTENKAKKSQNAKNKACGGKCRSNEQEND